MAMSTQPADEPAGRAEIEAARLLLARMGVDPADLVAMPAQRPPAPTFATYIPIVTDAVPAGTRRAYSSCRSTTCCSRSVMRRWS
jgi:hypothetical protein